MTLVTDPTLAMIRSESSKLIRDEVRTAEQRRMLESAVADAILKLGCTPDDISEASGLTLTEIKRILSDVRAVDADLAHLAGLR